MASFFRRRQKRVDVPRLKPRRETAANATRVDLTELTPELVPYLGQAAYLQLVIFETLSTAVSSAPSAAAKEAVSHAAALSLSRHHGLVAELTRKGVVPGEAMAPYVDRIDEFSRVTTGADWHEILITSYVTSGLLNDFFLRLAGGFSGDVAERLRAIYSSDDGHELLVGQLREAIEKDPPVASRLAMWGRRLVGDTLLIARSVVFRAGESDEARLEPVFTELIAAHTRRMDALGLTA